MKHMKTITVPAHSKEVIDYVTCDLCGEKIINRSDYSLDEVEVRHKSGVAYPDGGHGDEVEVDVCGKCFDTKLVPWLISQGAKIQSREWDY